MMFEVSKLFKELSDKEGGGAPLISSLYNYYLQKTEWFQGTGNYSFSLTRSLFDSN